MSGIRSQYRFFLPRECVDEPDVRFPTQVAHQIRRVLRLGVGDSVLVLDGSGSEFLVELTEIATAVEGQVVSSQLNQGEPKLQISLFQALIRPAKFELVLQKCTELGVASFQPVLCERSVQERPGAERLRRYADIVREASEQSARGIVPMIHSPISFDVALSRSHGHGLLLTKNGESVATLTSRNIFKAMNTPHFGIFVGPEGGFSDVEVRVAQRRGISLASLGPRTLRSETASIVATALVLSEFGELRRPAESEGRLQ